METKTNRSFWPLFVTNFFGVVNDNFLKTLASFVVIGWVKDEKMQSCLMGLTAGALVLPYILCSPLAGRMMQTWRKTTIVQMAKWAELPIMAIAIAGFALHSAGLVIFSVFLMGLQSSLYSPAKYALVRDVGGADRVSTGMGGMDGLAFFGMLAGTVAASFLVDGTPPPVHYACLVAFAALGLLSSYTVKADEEMERERLPIDPLAFLNRVHREVLSYPGLNAVICTLSVFWWAAASLQIGLLIYGRQVLRLDSSHTGLMLALAAVGITAGQVLAGVLDRRLRLLEKELVIGWLASGILFALYFVPLGPAAFSAALALLAFVLGFFKLPFDAEIQKVVKGPALNRVLAYFNQVSFIFILVASATFALTSIYLGVRALFLVLGTAMLVAPVCFLFSYRRVLCATGRWIFRRRYDVRVEGLELMEEGKTYLVLPNHPAIMDPMLVTAELYRTPLRPLADELFFRNSFISKKVLKTLDAVLVPDLRKHATAKGAGIARALNGVVTDALASGRSVIFYPSGHIWTEPREEIGTRQLAYNVCRALPENVRVIGVRTTGLWGSIWSRHGRTASPSFVPTLAKSVFLWVLYQLTFHPRRPVTIHLEDLTDRVRDWSTLTRLEFNRHLEDWYNFSAFRACNAE